MGAIMSIHGIARRRLPGLILGVMLFTGGCASTGSGGYGSNEESGLAAGSTVVLNERLDLRGHANRVYLQHGRVIRFQDRDRFDPWCSFGLRRQGDEPLPPAIEPDRFRTGPAHNSAHARALPPEGVRVASRDLRFILATFSGPGPSPGHVTHVVKVPLTADGQPQVRDLTCAVDRDTSWRGTVGVESMRAAVGDIVTIIPAES